MNYLLSNRSTSSLQTLSKETWSRILSLARFYGWQPMGTLPPFIHNLRKPSYTDGANGVWDGTYLRNEGQVVRTEDALALAGALQASLDDIPDVNPDRELTMEDDLPEWFSPAEKAIIRDGLEEHKETPLGILPFEYFAGDGKQNLLDFIRFCMLGEFVIS
ncbi:MAG TPA: hypothetical protein VFR47_25545 [Anaerolineales bacterium]|nr:hypothetical protein [Anaerolineales bacterium]